MIQRRGSRVVLLVGLVFCVWHSHCTPKKIASDITSQIFVAGTPAFERESDIDLAEKSGLTMLKMLEAFQHDNPSNKNYLILLSRSYANYAYAFLEWNILRYQDIDESQRAFNEERAKMFYQKGRDFGIQILNRNAAFEKAMTKDLDTLKRALRKMGRRYATALFWTAFNWGSYINHNKDSPAAIAEFPKVEAMMKRALELDDLYFYGGPHLFFGFAYGSRPTMFGGDPAKSKVHFEKALAAYNRRFLMTHVAYAQSYCIQNQDRPLFESLLNEVLQAPSDILPEQRMATELSKLRAKWYLDHASQYF